MRDNKRRIAALLLALALCLGLAGCGTMDPGDRDGIGTGEAGQDLPPGKDPRPDAGGMPDDVPGIDGPIIDEPIYVDVYGEQDGILYGFSVPEWDGEHAWVTLNDNVPMFDTADLIRTDAFETYSELDGLGRCGVAYANICPELQPTEPRGEIGNVRPTGWHTIRYNDLIAGNYLYNRCHLIGFQLAGENANELNLITGTRYLNIDGMLDFENMIDDYVDATGNHVLYRVTPWFRDDELVCRGLTMEAYSVEDNGEGVRFFAWAYNVQPGVEIDYATGESRRADGRDQDAVMDELENGPELDFVLNIKSGKFHLPECRYASEMADGNRLEITATIAAMLQAGYSPCGTCRPAD